MSKRQPLRSMRVFGGVKNDFAILVPPVVDRHNGLRASGGCADEADGEAGPWAKCAYL